MKNIHDLKVKTSKDKSFIELDNYFGDYSLLSNNDLNYLISSRILKLKNLGYYGPDIDNLDIKNTDRRYDTPEEANNAYALYYDKHHKDNPQGYVKRDEWDANLSYKSCEDDECYHHSCSYIKENMKNVFHIFIYGLIVNLDIYSFCFEKYKDKYLVSVNYEIVIDECIDRAICIAILKVNDYEPIKLK